MTSKVKKLKKDYLKAPLSGVGGLVLGISFLIFYVTLYLPISFILHSSKYGNTLQKEIAILLFTLLIVTCYYGYY